MVFTAFNQKTCASLRKFHRDTENRAPKIGASIAGLSTLYNQVATNETTLKDLSSAMRDYIVANQKDINREFVFVIEQAMQGAYDICVAEHGKTSFVIP